MNQNIDEYVNAINGTDAPARLLRDRRQQRDMEQTISHLQMVERSTVAAEHLTNDPKWDMFLSVIQGSLDQTKNLIEMALDQLVNSDLIDPNALMSVKIRHRELVMQQRTLEAVMVIPKSLMDDAEKARDVLSKLQDRDEHAGA